MDRLNANVPSNLYLQNDFVKNQKHLNNSLHLESDMLSDQTPIPWHVTSRGPLILCLTGHLTSQRDPGLRPLLHRRVTLDPAAA